jgi:hypothetical protein
MIVVRKPAAPLRSSRSKAQNPFFIQPQRQDHDQVALEDELVRVTRP